MVEVADFEVVRVCRVKKEGSRVKAFADLRIGENFVVKGFRIVQGEGGLFVSMPQEPGKDGKWYDTAFPTSKEKRQEISEVILAAYNG